MDSKFSVVDTDEGGFAVNVDDCSSDGFETGVGEIEVTGDIIVENADIIAGKVEIVDLVVSEAEVVKVEVDVVDVVKTVVGEIVVGKTVVGDVEIRVIEVCETDC